jgi:chromosome partitioning protein
MIIGILNQKGGVLKSTIARTLGVEFVKSGWDVHAADMDKTQHTLSNWNEIRLESDISPRFSSAVYADAKTALKSALTYDLLLVDCAAYADTHTVDVALASDLIIIPTGVTLDDLKASLSLATELTLKGVNRQAILFVVVKVPPSGGKEAMSARQSIADWGFTAAQGWILTQTGYGQALDAGRTILETRYPSLNEKADRVFQSIIDHALALQEA